MSTNTSDIITRLQRIAPPASAEAALRRAIAEFPDAVSPGVITYLARDFRVINLYDFEAAHTNQTLLRKSNDPRARALSNFLEFQSVTKLVRQAFVQDASRPTGIDELFRWAASQLHLYGAAQSKVLACVAARICQWCFDQGVKHLHIVESPLGGTLPSAVFAKTLKSVDIEVTVHEFLTPRLNRHGTKNSIRSAAREFYPILERDTSPILFPDEVVTGTRFKYLYAALRHRLKERVVPIALQVRNFAQGPPDQLALGELKSLLSSLTVSRQGAPTLTTFPSAAQFKVDEGAPLTASAPFYWAEIDLCAGKRKINYLFGLINVFRFIAQELTSKKNDARSILFKIFPPAPEEADGIDEMISTLPAKIDWDTIERSAREKFPNDYVGVRPVLDESSVMARQEWILQNVYQQLLPQVSNPQNKQGNEAGFVQNALRVLFNYKGGYFQVKQPPSRDYCEYTIEYAHPLRAFHEELVRLTIADLP